MTSEKLPFGLTEVSKELTPRRPYVFTTSTLVPRGPWLGA
jgi:hypothetical protein